MVRRWTGRGGTARRIDGPIRVRPAPNVFGRIALDRDDAARTRFVVGRPPRRTVLPRARLAHSRCSGEPRSAGAALRPSSRFP